VRRFLELSLRIRDATGQTIDRCEKSIAEAHLFGARTDNPNCGPLRSPRSRHWIQEFCLSLASLAMQQSLHRSRLAVQHPLPVHIVLLPPIRYLGKRVEDLTIRYLFLWHTLLLKRRPLGMGCAGFGLCRMRRAYQVLVESQIRHVLIRTRYLSVVTEERLAKDRTGADNHGDTGSQRRASRMRMRMRRAQSRQAMLPQVKPRSAASFHAGSVSPCFSVSNLHHAKWRGDPVLFLL
jgi:hypothetical protein